MRILYEVWDDAGPQFGDESAYEMIHFLRKQKFGARVKVSVWEGDDDDMVQKGDSVDVTSLLSAAILVWGRGD